MPRIEFNEACRDNRTAIQGIDIEGVFPAVKRLFNVQRQFGAAVWLLLTTLLGVSGCQLSEPRISDRLPKGRLIPIDQIPATILPDAKRKALPAGTTVEHCEGDLYRFNYPDGQILFRNSKGEDCGGII